MTTVLRTKWFMPLFSLALGVVCLVAFWLGDRPEDGLFSLGLMAVFAALLLLGGRSDGRDERWARIDIYATAFAGHVTIGAVLVGCFWEWAHGRDGSPFVQLGAIAGLAYLGGVAWMRWRG